MATSAKRRQCPQCGRKSAIVRLSLSEDEFIAAYCRWDDCNYVRVRGEQNQDRDPASSSPDLGAVSKGSAKPASGGTQNTTTDDFAPRGGGSNQETNPQEGEHGA